MGKPGEPIDPNFRPILPAPPHWRLQHLPSSSALRYLPATLKGVPEKPAGLKPKISELELAQKLLGQIEHAGKLDCSGVKCNAGRIFLTTRKLKKEFIKGFIHSITNPKRPIGRQNLRLGTYCPRPENLIYGFKKLVEEGVNITVNKGGKIYHKIYFNDLQGPGTGGVFTQLIIKQCGLIRGLEKFYKSKN